MLLVKLHWEDQVPLYSIGRAKFGCTFPPMMVLRNKDTALLAGLRPTMCASLFAEGKFSGSQRFCYKGLFPLLPFAMS